MGIKTIHRNSALGREVSLRTFVALLIDGNLTLVKGDEKQTAEFTDYARKLAVRWVAFKNRSTGRTPKPCKVIPITKGQLDAARAAVKKLWGPPPKRGAAVHTKRAA